MEDETLTVGIRKQIIVPAYVNWNRDGLMWNVSLDEKGLEPSHLLDGVHKCQAQDCTSTETTLYNMPTKPPELRIRWFCVKHQVASNLRLVQIDQYDKITGEGQVEFVIDGPRKLGYLKLLKGQFYGTR